MTLLDTEYSTFQNLCLNSSKIDVFLLEEAFLNTFGS